ncbi:MAG: M48 family metallopeptidase [Verrucomicrobiia bacterium]
MAGTVACTTVPETGRSQLNLISPSMERGMGRDAFTNLKASTPLSGDQNATAVLQRVGSRITAVADLPKAQWEFVLFENSQANAFCLPGGKVGVYTGMLQITQSEAGLATVLAHEVAHAVAHHGAERISRMLVVQGLGLALISQFTKLDATSKNALMLAYGLGTTLGTELPHSRLQESEADRIGLIYMARAGYDPAEAIKFWQRFAEYNRAQGGSRTPWFLRTHPLDEQRIEDLKRLLPEAQLQYRPRGKEDPPVTIAPTLPKEISKIITLIVPKTGARKVILWKPGMTIYTARRKAGIRPSGPPQLTRAGKLRPAKPATTLKAGDIVRWK